MLADNEIIREMMAQLLPLESRSAVTVARSQQGLLHLRLCWSGAIRAVSPFQSSNNRQVRPS